MGGWWPDKFVGSPPANLLYSATSGTARSRRANQSKEEMRLIMANITQDDEWMMEAGIVARMYMTPRQIRAYRSGRWVEGIHYKKHSPNPLSTEGRATLLYNYTKINKLVGDT